MSQSSNNADNLLNPQTNNSEPLRLDDLENKIINADCMDILRQLPDKCVDLVMTSPPYDNLRTYNDTCNWSFDVFKPIANELYRVMKDGGVIVWNVADATINGSETGTSFKQALYFKEIGFNIHDTMIWEKENSGTIGAMDRYENTFEYMFVFSKGKPKSVNLIKDKINKSFGTKAHATIRKSDGTTVRNINTFGKEVNAYGRRKNVWLINPVQSNIERCGHPAPFPIRLASDHIISWSNENDIVLDPFSGSGTTAIACHRLNRRFICIEKDKEYWEASCKRLEDERKQLKLF